MNIQALIEEWYSNDEIEAEYNEDLQAAFATIDGHEVSMAWTPDAGLITWGVINVDGTFYNEDGTIVGKSK